MLVPTTLCDKVGPSRDSEFMTVSVPFCEIVTVEESATKEGECDCVTDEPLAECESDTEACVM